MKWPYRSALFTEDGRMAGDVSRSDNWYNMIQYDDILQDTADAIRRKKQEEDIDLNLEGEIELADDYHKMRAETLFDSEETRFTLGEDDAIQTGLNIQSGHSGFHGLKIQPAALREICSNGMKGWVAEQTYQQKHSEEYQPELIHHGVDAVFNGTDQLERRLKQAQEETLRGGKDELRLLMHDHIEEYLDTPIGDIPLTIEEEIENNGEVSLYNAYQAMTRALTHHANQNLPQYKLDEGFEKAGQLLENGANQLPNPNELGRQAVEARMNELVEIDYSEDEMYWEDEDETVRELAEIHNITA